MPFTPSHAVVALPFVRTPLVPAAMAIGAMTPDLPLFVRGAGIDYGFTHSYANLVGTGLLAFVLFLLWRVVLRPAVPELVSDWLARRMPEDWSEPALTSLRRSVGIGQSRWYPVWLAASVLLGVASHILWDSFTHEGRWGVAVFPALAQMWGPFTGFKWLQYITGVLALVVLAAWAAMRLMRAVPHETGRRALPLGVVIAWWISLPVILITAWVLGGMAYDPYSTEVTTQQLAYKVLPPACAIWGALTLVLCVLRPLFRRRHQLG